MMEARIEKLLEEIAAFGRENDARETDYGRRMMNITPDTGRFLNILIRATLARNVVEVGTSNGYSTIWLADGVRETDGRVISLEREASKIAMARENLARSGLDHLVKIRQGLAIDLLGEMPGPLDFVFLDADRQSLTAYLDVIFPILTPGGLIVVDNAISHADQEAAYLERVRSHPGLESVTVPIGNGEEVSYKVR